MSSLLALLNLLLLFVTTLLFDGSGRYFKVSTKTGEAPLVVTIDATLLKKSKRADQFVWSFGDGESLTTSNPITTHQYKTAGTFKLSLIYQEI